MDRSYHMTCTLNYSMNLTTTINKGVLLSKRQPYVYQKDNPIYIKKNGDIRAATANLSQAMQQWFINSYESNTIFLKKLPLRVH